MLVNISLSVICRGFRGRDAGGCGRCGCGISLRCRGAYGRASIPAFGRRRGPLVSLGQDFPFGIREALSVALRAIFPPVDACGGCGMLRCIVAVGAGLPLHSVVGRQVAEFSRLSLCGGLGRCWGRNSPSGLARGSPWFCEPFSGFALSGAAGLACSWSTCLGSCFLRSRANQNFCRAAAFFISRAAKIMLRTPPFLSWMRLILLGAVRIYPVMGCHPSRGLVWRHGVGHWVVLRALRSFAKSRCTVRSDTQNTSAISGTV